MGQQGRHPAHLRTDRAAGVDQEISHLVRIPANLVRAVCEVPFGAHPGGVSNQGVKELDTYADDYDYLERASRREQDPGDHGQVVRGTGSFRGRAGKLSEHARQVAVMGAQGQSRPRFLVQRTGPDVGLN